MEVPIAIVVVEATLFLCGRLEIVAHCCVDGGEAEGRYSSVLLMQACYLVTLFLK